MNTLSRSFPTHVIFFASPSYWPNPEKINDSFQSLSSSLRQALPEQDAKILNFYLATNENDIEKIKAATKNELALFLPMSGGVQPLMLAMAEHFSFVGIVNAYLPEMHLPFEKSQELLEANAHPSCTDFYAKLRMNKKPVFWIGSEKSLRQHMRAWQASQRLKHAKLLKIGETEPWVINSCRDPKIFKSALGVEVIPVTRDTVYQEMQNLQQAGFQSKAKDWKSKSSSVEGLLDKDIEDASKVIAGVEKLLEKHQADGISMSCFSMIQDIDTTSCLTLSYLNDSLNAVGACEGDLEAAVTLYLLKALGADFVWMANPIIYEENYIDMVHCTSPRKACGAELSYRLLRHHESGRGVSPEVRLPEEQTVTLARIGNNLTEMMIETGKTSRITKAPTCHTQIRVNLNNVQNILKNLMGTHLIMSYGDFSKDLELCSQFLSLKALR